jgi:hypothetical protein
MSAGNTERHGHTVTVRTVGSYGHEIARLECTCGWYQQVRDNALTIKMETREHLLATPCDCSTAGLVI